MIFLVKQRRAADNDALCGKYNSKPSKLALVTTLWTAEERWPQHRSEVLHSLAINLRNRFLSKIHVYLDGPAGASACTRLESVLKESYHTSAQTMSRLNCQYVHVDQISYFEIFHLVKREAALKEYVIVLANADMVFDDTIMKAKFIPEDTLLTVATRGVPTFTSRMFFSFRFIQRHTDRCYRRPRIRDSWDAYIFHPANLNLNESMWFDELTGRHFPMNKIWAEESALFAIHSSSSSILKFFQACDVIHMWHLHKAPKTYEIHDDTRVLHSAVVAGDCTSMCECLGMNSHPNRDDVTLWASEDLPWHLSNRPVRASF